MDINKKKAYGRHWVAVKRQLKKHSTSRSQYEPVSLSSEDSQPEIDENEGEEVAASLLKDKNDSSVKHNVHPDIMREMWNNIDDHIILSSDSGTEEDEELETLNSQLKTCINTHGIPHNAADNLLKILREHGHIDLPATARTLLGTAKCVQIIHKSGMEYIHIGLKKQLQNYLQICKNGDQIEEIKLVLNIDGLPLFKSSNFSLWPVLCQVHGASNEPITIFPISICYGQSKPKDLDFLVDTIQEVQELEANGLDMGRLVRVSLKCIVCDAPAKSFVKGIKLYSGYYGCDHCNQRGLWVGRITYPETKNLQLRTNDTFRSLQQAEHHNVMTPFTNISNLDMIKQFPLDYMHQACLGVTRRLLLLWLRGKREYKLSANQSSLISQKLIDLSNDIPHICARKPRSLQDIDRWKATEYRQFLLYTGKIVLKGILRDVFYTHFLCFSVALNILVSEELLSRHASYAHQLLQYFVEQGAELYGKEFLVYNVHSLLHLTSDALSYGGLDNCSAFSFENYLQKIKKTVRSGRNPLAQVVKRLEEGAATSTKPQGNPNVRSQIQTKTPDNAFILSNSSACVVVDKRWDKEDWLYVCKVFKHLAPLFHSPCNSTLVSAFKTESRKTTYKLLPASNLQRKAIMIQQDPKTIFLGILHQQ